jgi:beta-alanine degradation protein BauB
VTEFTFDPGDFADELAQADANFTVGSRLLHEDGLVRVWDITLEPGDRLPFHRHRNTYLYRCHSGSATRVRFPDGRGVDYVSEPDEVHVHEIAPGEVVIHDLENAGDTTLAFTTIELLQTLR